MTFVEEKQVAGIPAGRERPARRCTTCETEYLLPRRAAVSRPVQLLELLTRTRLPGARGESTGPAEEAVEGGLPGRSWAEQRQLRPARPGVGRVFQMIRGSLRDPSSEFLDETNIVDCVGSTGN